MSIWKKRRQRQLSAYLDGELDAARSARLGEELAFDPGLRRQLVDYQQLDELVGAALDPGPVPDAEPFAARFGQPPSLATASAPPRRHPLGPVALAAGLLLTAGITFAGLRRRGLV